LFSQTWICLGFPGLAFWVEIGAFDVES